MEEKAIKICNALRSNNSLLLANGRLITYQDAAKKAQKIEDFGEDAKALYVILGCMANKGSGFHVRLYLKENSNLFANLEGYDENGDILLDVNKVEYIGPHELEEICEGA
ncbi:MAG: hypothetical protein NTY09_14560 [bacterium]|nr:hypothetical protein [bacterium]